MPERGYSWRDIPRWSAALFLFGVFCLFSTIGFIGDIIDLGRQPAARLALSVILSGGFAVVYALLGFRFRSSRGRWWIPVLPVAVVQFFLQFLMARTFPLARRTEMDVAEIARLEHRFSIIGIFLIVAVIGSYSSFLFFAITEGRRYFRVHAEMQLAREIHRVLVPPLAAQISGFEFHGDSTPSSEVGGDLIDVVSGEHGWVAYVADVSGHGVAPGVVMGMAKSAARMHLGSGGRADELLPRLHAVLQPLMKPNMFVTMACLSQGEHGLRYTLAGHPPILHLHAASGEISELAAGSLPVGLLPDSRFEAASVQCLPGDLFVLLTDGLLEVSNEAGEEFGIAGVKAVLQRHPELPLAELKQALVEAARRHGPVVDDQSVVLVRRERERQTG